MTTEVPLEFRIKVSSLIERELLVNSENWLSEPFYLYIYILIRERWLILVETLQSETNGHKVA